MEGERLSCAKELPALSIEDKVWIKDIERPAKVIRAAPAAVVMSAARSHKVLVG